MNKYLLPSQMAREIATYDEMVLLGQNHLIAEVVGSIQKRTAKAQCDFLVEAGWLSPEQVRELFRGLYNLLEPYQCMNCDTNFIIKEEALDIFKSKYLKKVEDGTEARIKND